MCHENLHGVGRDEGHLAVRAELGQELRNEGGNVFSALTKRGQIQVEDGNPEEQIFAEAARFYFLVEVTMRGGDQSKVGGDVALASEATDDALLQHAQKLCLQRRAELRDLVQKECPLMGLLDTANALVTAPVKAPFS
jgi:hypothetical protein